MSQKETDRNNAVYKIQDNRNPYIDHPEWVSEIWGDTLSGISNAKKSNIKIWYSNNQINISGLKSNATKIVLYDYTGKEINVLNSFNSKTEISLNNGLYIATLFQNNLSYTLKFVVAK